MDQVVCAASGSDRLSNRRQSANSAAGRRRRRLDVVDQSRSVCRQQRNMYHDLLALLILVGSVVVETIGEDASQCDIENPRQRLDCYPQDGSNSDKCIARGCCWNPHINHQTFPPLNVPYCYYPRNYIGYKVVDNRETANGGAVIQLERVRPSNVDIDIAKLRVEVEKQTDSILRIRIVDPTNKRWEPPLPSPPPPAAQEGDQSKATYTFNVTDDNQLNVFRLDNGRATTRLMRLNLATMVYTDRFIEVTSALPSDVLFGLGEHKGRLRRSTNFTRLTFYNEDRVPAKDARLYGTHPLYVNIEKDGRSNGVWLRNSNALDIVLTPAPAITYRPVGGVLDFFVLIGPTPGDVVKQYQHLVGRPKMVPYWSLGYHLCRFGYHSTNDTRRVMQANLDAGVRIDVQWNDIDYMHNRNDFTLDPVNFKDLGKFVREVQKGGRHYVLIIDPAISGSEPPGTYPPFDRGLDYNVFVKDLKGKIVRGKVWNRKSSVFPDFTHPNATPYWTEMFQHFHNEVPFDGAWIDMNEPANMINGHMGEGCPDDAAMIYVPGDEPLISKTLCISDQHYWSSHYNVHNLYGFTEAIATYNALSSIQPTKRPFIISRSTFSGFGFYAGHWTGDVYSTWQDLKDSVSGILEFSLYGIPMVGVDICGFNGNTTVELCARWQALGAFYPFSRNHNSNDAIPQDPASMGDEVLVPTRNAYYWRYKLLPYLYTLFYRAHVSGETVARPLFFDNPTVRETYDIDDQFMWGEALMVVPALYQRQTTIEAFFPQGVWYDLQNRTAIIHTSRGGTYVTLSAFNDTINFFMKGGHSVFFQEPGETTTESLTRPYGLYVFLDEAESSEGELFVDDGESIDSLETGRFQVVHVKATESMILVGTIAGKPTANIILDRVHVYGARSRPQNVSVAQHDFVDFTYDPQRMLLTLYNLNTTMDNITILIHYD